MESGGILDDFVIRLLAILTLGYSRVSPQLQSVLSTTAGLAFMLSAVAYILDFFQFFGWFMWQTVKTFLWAFLFFSYLLVTQQFIDYCIWGGLQIGGVVSGGQMSVEDFKRPSVVVGKGFVAVRPIKDFIQSHTGWGVLFNWFTLFILLGAWFVIQTAFIIMGLYLTFAHIMMAFTTAWAVLWLVFGILPPLAFLAERAIGLFIASAVRLGAAALVIGLVFPFIESFFLNPEAPNPDLAAAIWLAIGSAFFTALVIVGPSTVHAAMAGGHLFSASNLIPGAAMFRRLGRAA